MSDAAGTGLARRLLLSVPFVVAVLATQQLNAQTASPIVTAPTASVAINSATFNVQGTAAADSLVRVYSDLSDNGVIDGTDPLVGSQQLSGGATSFSVSVSLTQDAANSFLATADDPVNTESAPADVPTITEDSTAPAAPVVIDPASAINVVGTTYDIQGTAEADSLVLIYRDSNNNSVLDGGDTLEASGVAISGNFNVTTPIALGVANDFLVTAEDAVGNESGPTDVPTITETTTLTAPPVITRPFGSIKVDKTSFDIEGTVVADSLVRIYIDLNDNGLIDGADIVVGQEQLSGGGTDFSISVALTQHDANNFTATADDATNPESSPVDVPTITDEFRPYNSQGTACGGDCACTGSGRSRSWSVLAGLIATMLASVHTALRRRA